MSQVYTIPVTFSFNPQVSSLSAEEVRQRVEDVKDKELWLMMQEVDDNTDERITIEQRNAYYKSNFQHAH